MAIESQELRGFGSAFSAQQRRREASEWGEGQFRVAVGLGGGRGQRRLPRAGYQGCLLHRDG